MVLMAVFNNFSAKDDRGGREIDYSTFLDQVREGVVATGVISTTWNGDCSRCLRPVEGMATTEVEELFEEHPREGESYPLHQEFIDLEPMVRDAILLELPVGVVRSPKSVLTCRLNIRAIHKKKPILERPLQPIRVGLRYRHWFLRRKKITEILRNG